MAQQCTHLNQIRKVTPSARGCEDCLAIGDTWVHLRLCLSCGHVGCCVSGAKPCGSAEPSRCAPGASAAATWTVVAATEGSGG